MQELIKQKDEYEANYKKALQDDSVKAAIEVVLKKNKDTIMLSKTAS